MGPIDIICIHQGGPRGKACIVLGEARAASNPLPISQGNLGEDNGTSVLFAATGHAGHRLQLYNGISSQYHAASTQMRLERMKINYKHQQRLVKRLIPPHFALNPSNHL